MPIIKIEFDKKIDDTDIFNLSTAIKKIVSDKTKIQDVFVYANSSKITIDIAPIEIFIEMSSEKIINREDLIKKIKTELSDWKKLNNFNYPINLTLIPMNWNIEIVI